uniref:Uncharacterized protein n=1 Tax=Timema douglasi TaxID=61478 RepID=A0A7R8VJQ9_TIMDO|nr:unnamed protein product [Timema douglasi]
MKSSSVASLVLTDSSQLTSDSQHLVNLTGVGRVDMSNFELLKVLGTGGVTRKDSGRGPTCRFIPRSKSTPSSFCASSLPPGDNW